jgi:soluble lytic murein transglycosylase-like protein
MIGYTGTEEELKDPHVNAVFAAKYLRKQLDRYDQNIPFAISAYNAGSLCVNKNGKFCNETHIKKVLHFWAENR